MSDISKAPVKMGPCIRIGHGSISLKCDPDTIQMFVDSMIGAQVSMALDAQKNEIERLKMLCRHTYPEGTYCIQIDYGDFHNRRYVERERKDLISHMAKVMLAEIDAALSGAPR